MPPDNSWGTPAFRRFAAILAELHALIREGCDEGPEGDALRDESDLIWKGMSEDERERTGSLSEDLYSLGEDAPLIGIRPTTPEVQADLATALLHRRERNWKEALDRLRLRRDSIPPGLLSYLRGRVWHAAGVPEAAAEFYRHAFECEPRAAYEATLRVWTDAAEPRAKVGA